MIGELQWNSCPCIFPLHTYSLQKKNNISLFLVFVQASPVGGLVTFYGILPLAYKSFAKKKKKKAKTPLSSPSSFQRAQWGYR